MSPQKKSEVDKKMATMGQMNGQPVVILSEGSRRTLGRDAQRMNITAGRLVAEAVRTTLGPKGMDKMLVNNLGDVVITNDGATIMNEMDIQHPAAKMLVEVSKAQEDEVGDGTTTAVVLAGELLKRAEDLLDQEIHPTVIVHGYKLGNEKAQEILQKVADSVSPDDKETLLKIAATSMTGKSAEHARDPLAKLSVDAVLAVSEKVDGKIRVDKDNIQIEKKQGGSVNDSELLLGVIIDKERLHTGMPERVKSAKIALLDAAIEIKETETDAEIQITDPSKLKDFLDQEEKMLKDMVEKVKKSGANVLFCQKGVDDVAQHFLAKAGIFAARRVKKSDMEKLARATGARIVSSLDDLSEKDIGHSGNVEERKIAGDKMIFVTECKNPKAVSLLVRGGTEHVVDEAERALEDSIGAISATLETGKVVAGGGAIEIEVAKQLRDYAQKVGGREQLALNAFADAIESIPRALAENAGLDPIDILVDLKSKHEDPANKWYGLDALDGKSKDMKKLGVLEPVKIKTQAIKSASEAASMILRIDDVISAKASSAGGQGGMPGMGGHGMEGGELD